MIENDRVHERVRSKKLIKNRLKKGSKMEEDIKITEQDVQVSPSHPSKEESKKFYIDLFKIALPLVFQNVLMQSLDFIDQIMISSIGTEEIAAVGVCTKIVSIFMSALYAIGSGGMFFLTQYYGTENKKAFRRTIGISTSLCFVFALLMVGVVTLWPTQVMQMFDNNPVVIASGDNYFRYARVAYLCIGLTFPLSFGLRSIGKVKTILGISILSAITNVSLNAILIFGLFGFPQMGIAGAALGTTLSRLVELSIYLIVVYKQKLSLFYYNYDMFRFDLKAVKTFFKRCFPLIVNEMMWQMGFVVYFIIYGKRGTEALATITIMSTLMMMSKLFIAGFSGASQIVIGPVLGRKQMDLVDLYIKRFIKISWITGAIASGLVLAMIVPVQKWYSIEGTITGEYVWGSMFVLALYALLNAYPSISIEGFFRVGGDNHFIALIDMGSVWIVGVVFTYITSSVLNLPIVIVFMSIVATEIFKFPLVYGRLKNKKWIHFA